MRIVQLNPFHYPFNGGIEHRIHHISARLAKEHEVIVLTGRLPGTSEREEMEGYTVLRLESRYLNIYNPPYVRTEGIAEALADIAPDVVDYHYRWAPSYTKAMRSWGGPRVFTFHNTFGEGSGMSRSLSVLNDMLFSSFMRTCNKVVCVSGFVRDDLVKRGFHPQLMEVVPNGVEPNPIVPTDDGFVLFVGRLVGTKGLPFLIESMRDVKGGLVICGSGPERERLEAMTKKLGVEEKVVFKGRVEERTKQQLMASCRVFVMPSTYESYGIAVAEAMMCGKPIVASRVGGLPEVVGEGGILVPPADPVSLSQAINSLLSDPDLCLRMGREAREQAAKYSWDRAAEAMEKIYIDVATCPRRGG